MSTARTQILPRPASAACTRFSVFSPSLEDPSGGEAYLAEVSPIERPNVMFPTLLFDKDILIVQEQNVFGIVDARGVTVWEAK
jgi:hypothetical protein